MVRMYLWMRVYMYVYSCVCCWQRKSGCVRVKQLASIKLWIRRWQSTL